MEKSSEAQAKALKALDNPEILEHYDDGSIDINFEGRKLAMSPSGKVMTPSEYLKKIYKPWQESQAAKKETKKPKATTFLSHTYSSGTPCSRNPAQCKPREIKHVAWDADDTIWEIRPYGIASGITGKLTLLDPDTVVEERETYRPPAKESFQPELEPYDEGIRYKYGYRYGSTYGYPGDEEEPDIELNKIVDTLTEELTDSEKEILGFTGQDVKLTAISAAPPKEPAEKIKTTFQQPGKVYIKLMPGYRDTLDKLKEQGITSSIISLNTPGTVKRIIEKFGLTDEYLEIRDSGANKGTVFNEQMKTFGYKPQEAMFVDDNLGHVNDVAKSGAIALQMAKDIKEVAQIVRYMTNVT